MAECRTRCEIPDVLRCPESRHSTPLSPARLFEIDSRANKGGVKTSAFSRTVTVAAGAGAIRQR